MSKTVALHACRSGVGRSHIAGCLGAVLAQQGQRVAIVEASDRLPGTTDLLSLFGIAPDYPTRALSDDWQETVIWPAASADVTYLLGSADRPPTPGALHLLRSTASLNAKAADLRECLDALARTLQLDVILMALAPGLQPASLAPMAVSDAVLLLLSIDRRDFQGVAVSLDILQRLGVPQVQLVVNAVPSALNTQRWHEQVELAYATPVAGLLPWTDELALVTDHQLLCFRDPEAPFSLAVRALAHRLRTEIGGRSHRQPRQTPATPSQGLSLLDLIDLPEQPRRLLNWTLRQHRVSHREAIAFLTAETNTATTEATAQQILNDLLAHGILKTETEAEQVYYRPAIAPRQRRQVTANIWQALE